MSGQIVWGEMCHVSCRGMRSGTVPHTLAVGLGAACQVAAQEMEVSLQPRPCLAHSQDRASSQYDAEHITRLSKKLVDGVTSQLDHVIRNGDPDKTYNGNSVLYVL